MEKKILYHIGLYGFRKLIVYVIKDNGDNTNIPPRRTVFRHSFKLLYYDYLYNRIPKRRNAQIRSIPYRNRI